MSYSVCARARVVWVARAHTAPKGGLLLVRKQAAKGGELATKTHDQQSRAKLCFLRGKEREEARKKKRRATRPTPSRDCRWWLSLVFFCSFNAPAGLCFFPYIAPIRSRVASCLSGRLAMREHTQVNHRAIALSLVFSSVPLCPRRSTGAHEEEEAHAMHPKGRTRSQRKRERKKRRKGSVHAFLYMYIAVSWRDARARQCQKQKSLLSEKKVLWWWGRGAVVWFRRCTSQSPAPLGCTMCHSGKQEAICRRRQRRPRRNR
nr:hypothetical protein [Pandoravirus massiliensis]